MSSADHHPTPTPTSIHPSHPSKAAHGRAHTCMPAMVASAAASTLGALGSGGGGSAAEPSTAGSAAPNDSHRSTSVCSRGRADSTCDGPGPGPRVCVRVRRDRQTVRGWHGQRRGQSRASRAFLAAAALPCTCKEELPRGSAAPAASWPAALRGTLPLLPRPPLPNPPLPAPYASTCLVQRERHHVAVRQPDVAQQRRHLRAQQVDAHQQQRLQRPARTQAHGACRRHTRERRQDACPGYGRREAGVWARRVQPNGMHAGLHIGGPRGRTCRCLPKHPLAPPPSTCRGRGLRGGTPPGTVSCIRPPPPLA